MNANDCSGLDGHVVGQHLARFRRFVIGTSCLTAARASRSHGNPDGGDAVLGASQRVANRPVSHRGRCLLDSSERALVVDVTVTPVQTERLQARRERPRIHAQQLRSAAAA